MLPAPHLLVYAPCPQIPEPGGRRFQERGEPAGERRAFLARQESISQGSGSTTRRLVSPDTRQMALEEEPSFSVALIVAFELEENPIEQV